MLRGVSRILRVLFLLSAGTVLCGLIAGGAVLMLGMPDAMAGLGAPAPWLNPVERSLLGVYLILLEPELDRPAGEPGSSIELIVEPGETAAQVVSRLQGAGVVRNGDLLRRYLRYRGLDVGVETGRYRLNGGMSLREMAEHLQTAEPRELLLTVVEGWRIEQIADALPQTGIGFGAQDFLDAAHLRPTAYSFAGDLPPGASLEGFLFPDTYRLDPEWGAPELVLAMLDNFEARLDAQLRAAFRRQGLTLADAVIIASIVEREAVVPDERALIASVFLNRLSAGMKLDADPTVQYALGRQANGSWWKAPLTAADLQIDSPYNTYRYPGLPAGPIANPGLDSLRAVAFPARSPYLYFRATCDGSGQHVFAETFEEHLANACE